ncbi:hypothetical protein IscW_ISCW000041, partial [Ixodes scapularis]
ITVTSAPPSELVRGREPAPSHRPPPPLRFVSDSYAAPFKASTHPSAPQHRQSPPGALPQRYNFRRTFAGVARAGQHNCHPANQIRTRYSCLSLENFCLLEN